MTTYGPAGPPDDPTQRQAGSPDATSPGGSPEPPTVPRWDAAQPDDEATVRQPVRPDDDATVRQPAQPEDEPTVRAGSDPTVPQWGQPGSDATDSPWSRPPASGERTLPQWGQPPAGPAPAWGQAATPPASGAGQPPPTSGGGFPPPAPAPTSGGGFPPPTSGAGHVPSGAGPVPPGAPGGYPPPGPFPPAGPIPPGPPPAAGGQWGAPGGYAAPPAPPKKRGGKIALIIGLVVLLLLCPCLGLAGWAGWQAANDDSPSVSLPETSAAPAPPTRDALPTAEPSPTEDEGDDFARGDCVVNDGTDDEAELRKVPCGPDTYEVLLRIPATTDGDRCQALAPEATANYVHDNPANLLDYVLCLKER